MSNPNFSSILDQPASEVKPPPLIPMGTYTALVKGLPRYDKSTKKGTEFSEHTLQLLQAHDDVDTDALEEIGGLMEKTINVTYYHTEKSLFMLKDFCEACGVDLEGKSLRQAAEETPGCQVGVFIKHVPSDDGKRMYANVGRVFMLND
jgi:hypothetical protein